MRRRRVQFAVNLPAGDVARMTLLTDSQWLTTTSHPKLGFRTKYSTDSHAITYLPRHQMFSMVYTLKLTTKSPCLQNRNDSKRLTLDRNRSGVCAKRPLSYQYRALRWYFLFSPRLFRYSRCQTLNLGSKNPSKAAFGLALAPLQFVSKVMI